ncbi:hypothetical protein [Parasitella parasitica]|uniref:Uncharacterized protein n=1 Tax=Parasitella parasitica TaxID=35722 RepID=A0A0B7NFC4_9FUNG|nr:hypothetical protein [Parasitella parasitica]
MLKGKPSQRQTPDTRTINTNNRYSHANGDLSKYSLSYLNHLLDAHKQYESIWLERFSGEKSWPAIFGLPESEELNIQIKNLITLGYLKIEE